jgi:hypothetical protein
MKTNDIIELQEVYPNYWHVKYQGNYGVYTVKITLDEKGEVSDFSCTCPSNYYPCKHIGIVKEAIAERIAHSQSLADTRGKTLTVEDLLKNVSLQELHDFVVRQARYNTSLTNALKLEFAHKLTGADNDNDNEDEDYEDNDTNPYSCIIQDIMEDVEFDYMDYYEIDEELELDLCQWFRKARSYVEQRNFNEAVLICKACIEEFAEWMHNTDTDIVEYIDSYYYQTTPFEILGTAIANSEIDSKKLYDYCLSEMNKEKYSQTTMFNEFNDLLMILAAQTNSDEFIALQDSLLAKVDDNTSLAAEKILQREIDFYNKIQQPEKANELIEKNIQIEDFRYQVVTKRFAEENLEEAKRLIEDFVQEKRDTGRDYAKHWDELLLEIAQKENDINSIRTIAFSFIKRNFDRKYFDIYKSTFTSEEWNTALENLLQHYEKNSRDYNYFNSGPKTGNFSSSAANVLVVEGATKRLLNYIENNLSVERIEKYYISFVDLYPEKTIELFRKTTDDYVAENLGRGYYEHVAQLLDKIREIENGEKTVSEMVSCYRTKYKKRRLMMDILRRF